MPDTIEAPPVLRAPLNYLSRDVVSPSRQAGPDTTIPSETHLVPVRDGRPFADRFTLDQHGFALLREPTAVEDLYDDARVRAEYYPEVEALLPRHLGATRVVAFDHNIRNAARALGERRLRTPAKRVHNDYSYAAAPRRVRDILPLEADRLLRHRFAIVNLWRPLATVQESPLALAEWGSIADEDLVPSALVYADRVGETFSVRYSPRHRWWYFPRQTPDEALLIKCFDSALDGRARLSFHGAFDDPTSPPNAPPRESIEVRTLVFWEDADA